jgi:hypothetical protein
MGASMTVVRPVEVSEIRVGEKMRLSVQLIKQWQEERLGFSEVVTVVCIQVESDGTKTLVVTRDEPERP